MRTTTSMKSRLIPMLIASFVMASIGWVSQLEAQFDLTARSLTLDNENSYLRIRDSGGDVTDRYEISDIGDRLLFHTDITRRNSSLRAPLQLNFDAKPDLVTLGNAGVQIGGTLDGLPVAPLAVVSFGPTATNTLPEAKILVMNLNHDPMPRTMIQMVNPGGSRFAFTNPDTGKSWVFQNNNSDGFLVNLLGTGGNEFSIRKTGIVTMGPGGRKNFFLDAAGNLTLLGTVNQSSDRNRKQDFVEVDEAEVLAKIVAMPITSWSYKDDADSTLHIGPMSQDFHAAFQVGKDDKTISVTDSAGVAFAGIKALHHQIDQLNANNRRLQELMEGQQRTIEDLVAQLGDLSARVTANESASPR